MILFINMIIKIIFLILILINSIDNTYAGKIKEAKSFDEIFGQRWDEKEEENGGNETDQNLQIKEETATNCDQFEQLETNFEQISDHFSNAIDIKKREIVEKFHKIKEKIKQMGNKYSPKELTKIERKIAQKLGVNREKIYEWKREFGMTKKLFYSEEEKRKILKQFDQIYVKLKMKLNEKFEGKKEKCKKIIAKHWGVNINTIYKWKKEFKNGKLVQNQQIDDEKREIVEKYFKTKNEFMKMGKHSRKEWKEFYAKIKQIFGMSSMTIEKWTKKISINQNISKERKILTIGEKMEKIKQYYQIKKQNQKLKDYEIAKILNISSRSLITYKAKFGI